MTRPGLVQRAYGQAWILGADFIYGPSATGLRTAGPDRVVTLGDGSEASSRAVILATGVTWRRLGVPRLEALVGAGVFYGAAASEAPAMKGQEVYVVGGPTPPARPRSTWPGTRPGSPCWCGAPRWPSRCPTT